MPITYELWLVALSIVVAIHDNDPVELSAADSYGVPVSRSRIRVLKSRLESRVSQWYGHSAIFLRCSGERPVCPEGDSYVRNFDAIRAIFPTFRAKCWPFVHLQASSCEGPCDASIARLFARKRSAAAAHDFDRRGKECYQKASA